MKVFLIPEDSRRDKFILKPLFESLFRSIGKPRTRVRVCENPVLRGVGAAMNVDRLAQIVRRYKGETDIFVLCVDRDGDENRRGRLAELEARLRADRAFFAENAWEELETWVLAGLTLLPGWNWKEVRAEVHVKERYFDVLAEARGVTRSAGRGRKPLAEEAARSIGAIRRKCPEDFDALARRLETHVRTGGASV